MEVPSIKAGARNGQRIAEERLRWGVFHHLHTKSVKVRQKGGLLYGPSVKSHQNVTERKTTKSNQLHKGRNSPVPPETSS